MSTIRDTLLKLMSEVGEETVKRLEKILTETPDHTTAAVQSAVIAGQAETIRKLRDQRDELSLDKQEVADVLQAMTKECKEAQDDLATARAEVERWREENDGLRRAWRTNENRDSTLASLEVAHAQTTKRLTELEATHAQTMYGLSECARERDEATKNLHAWIEEHRKAGPISAAAADLFARQAKEIDRQAKEIDRLKEGEKSLRSALDRFQGIVRQTSHALRLVSEGVYPDITLIQDGCIKLYLKGVLDSFYNYKDVANSVEHARAIAQNRGAERDAAIKERDEARAELAAAKTALASANAEAFRSLEERDNYKKRKDDAYTERNRVVAAFAKLATIMDWPVAVTRTAIEGWSEDWHGCVFIDTPQGQVSWHFHDSHAGLFKHLPHGPAIWDGHTTPQKYERLEALVAFNPPVNLLREAIKLQDFKTLVHHCLDEMGISKFETEACRIMHRLNQVAGRLVPAGATLWNPLDCFHKLCIDACHEANRARGLFPKPDHLTLALAEEAGEVVKAVLDYKQKKTHLAAVHKEIVQTMAMCLRLACDGDPTVDLKRSQE
jgi:hypothetical protein